MEVALLRAVEWLSLYDCCLKLGEDCYVIT